jgi:hypothetical protein
MSYRPREMFLFQTFVSINPQVESMLLAS